MFQLTVIGTSTAITYIREVVGFIACKWGKVFANPFGTSKATACTAVSA